MYRSAPVGLCLVDRTLRFLRINERLAAINGRGVHEHIGRSVAEVIPELADQILPRYRKVLETGAPIENVEVEDPGTGRTWLVSDHPLKGPGGEVTGIVTVVQDISERKRAEADLRSIRDRLRLAESMARLGSWQWELHRDEIWWSSELYRIFRRDPADFTPTFDAFIEHVVSEDRSRVGDLLDAVWGGESQAQAEFRIIAADGEERVVRGIARLRRDVNDDPFLVFGTLQDVSEERGEHERWENERAAFARERAELENLLRERTGALDRALDRIRRRR